MTTAPRQGGLIATTGQLTIDCEAPMELAAFWAAALGYVPSPVPRAGLQARTDDGVSPVGHLGLVKVRYGSGA